MTVKFEQKLGAFKVKTHLLFWEARPDMDNLREFVVNISYSDVVEGEPKRVQIVRIDNIGKPLHMNQLWGGRRVEKRTQQTGNQMGAFFESSRGVS